MIKRLKNPARQLASGARLFRDFTGHDARRGTPMEKPRVPDVLVKIGRVDGILYTTKRDGKVEKYIHEFRADARPIFAVAPDGRGIFLLGGRYRFTARGIVDSRKKRA